MARRTIAAVVLGLPAAGTSTAFTMLDVLASVGRDWEMLHGDPVRPPVFAASLLSVDGRPYTDPNGRTVIPDGALDDVPCPDLVLVPDLHLDPSDLLPGESGPIDAWLAKAHEGGAIVASVCSGALLVAKSGLLNGLEATTHWGYADLLAQLHPDIRLRRERVIVPAGEGHRIITAGGASAWADLMLYLIARLAGPEEARRIAKIYLLEPHDHGQLCYASLVAGQQHDDKLVADAQVWVGEHYSLPNPVTELVKRSGLSERNFLRRFRRATGQSPTEYIQILRVEEAKQMLETTELAIEQIALEIGYTEPSSLRSAFRKHVGITAREYRRKWKGAFEV